MKYISTRDKNISKTASEAILQGLSSEGGLFVPQSIPQIDEKFIASLSGKTYPERAEAVMQLYLTDYSRQDIVKCARAAYEGVFEENDPAPVVKLGDEASVLELWHGPTCAFKDMALQMLPQLLQTARHNIDENKTAVILVATSGDTGKAALEGFKDVDGTKIMVFYPAQGVSDIQKLQMATQQGTNVAVQAVHGNFDDCQSAVKAIFSDENLAERLLTEGMYLTSANSINWGRLLPQIVYYFSAYSDLLQSGEISLGDRINVAVPTGNFGNILACYYAKRMGLPINKLICASNKNDVLSEFLNTGVYNRNREFYTTNTPSMDILISSNLERYLFHLLDEDDTAVAYCMYRLSEGGEYSVNAQVLERIQADFAAYSCDEAATLSTVAHTKNRYGYICDTHTAVAINAYNQYRAETGDSSKTLIVSTASPFKFADSVLSGLGQPVPEDEFAQLAALSGAADMPVPKPLSELAGKPVRFSGAVRPEAMTEALVEFTSM